MTSDCSTSLVAQVSSDDHLVSLWLAQRPALTARAYRDDWDRFRSACKVPLRSLTLGDVLAYASSLEAAGLSPATQARRLSSIRSLLSLGHRLGYLLFDVGAEVRVPRPPDRRHQRILSERQVYAILQATCNLRSRAMLTLLYSSGIRVGELVTVRWADLVQHLDAGHLHVTGKGGRHRSIFLSASTWELLEEYRESILPSPCGEDLVFPGRGGMQLTDRAVRLVVEGAAARAFIPAKVSPHWFRHAHASHALDRGCPLHVVRETLGHASLATTSVYVTARPTDSASRYLRV